MTPKKAPRMTISLYIVKGVDHKTGQARTIHVVAESERDGAGKAKQLGVMPTSVKVDETDLLAGPLENELEKAAGSQPKKSPRGDNIQDVVAAIIAVLVAFGAIDAGYPSFAIVITLWTIAFMLNRSIRRLRRDD